MSQLVSIIIPTFNRVHFLGETLDSVLSQTYSNWECIVVDDGCTDRTKELVNFYIEKSNRFKLYSFSKSIERGAGATRNFGYLQCKGEYIKWLDDDDLLHPNVIERQVLAAANSFDSLITCPWGRYYDEEPFKIKQLEIYRNYDRPVHLLRDYGLCSCFFPPHVFLLSRSLVGKSGLWRTDLAINDDGEYFSRAILAANEVIFADETFVMYRHHSAGQMSQLNTRSKAKDVIRSWKFINRNVNPAGKSFTEKYIKNGIQHSYILLKEGGYKSIILGNFFFFRTCLYQEFKKRTKKMFFIS